MATDYVLFVHGVNTREEREKPEYANSLIELIKQKNSQNQRVFKPLPLYWGDVNKNEERDLLHQLQASPYWEDMWFRKFREKQILQFAGDAALYISRHVGYKVVKTLKNQASVLANAQPEDRLHLVTHSWGTVILFDILFAARWNQEVPGSDEVMEIRDFIYGISGKDANPLKGIKISSIHTMGSPIAIFTLTNIIPGKDGADSPSTHDITPNLQKLLTNIRDVRNGKKLPWRNYIHPGDPIAYPLEPLMYNLIDGQKEYVDLQDIITQNRGLTNFLTAQTPLALISGGKAHGSYFQSDKVVNEICNILRQEAC